MKKKTISLAFKLNLLLTSMVLIVSLVLVNISVDSYSRTVYESVYQKLDAVERAMPESKEHILDRSYKVYLAAELPGLEAVRARAERENDGNILTQWLSSFVLDQSLNAFRHPYSDADYQQQTDGVSYSYFDAGLQYLSLGYTLKDLAAQKDISSITAVAEARPGEYIHLVRMNNSYDYYTEWNQWEFGRRMEHQPAIDTWLAQKTHTAFFLSEAGRTELIKVAPAEQNGVRFYFIYACDVTDIREGQRRFFLRCLLLVCIMVAAAILLSLILLRRMAIKPLKELARSATAFGARQDGWSREDVIDMDIRSRDEIGELCQEFRSMQTRIIEYTENITHMTAEKERISTELTMATRIQAEMLPSSFPAFPERQEFDIYATMTPAKEVGGDFYDFFLIDEDHLALVMADVAGKGVPAALFMMASKIILSDIAMLEQSPAEILRRANETICKNNKEEMFVTVWLGILEISTGLLTCANAGHEYPFLKEPGREFQLFRDKHGFVVGGMAGVKYRNYTLRLEPGAKLFVYTDGVPEATDETQTLFGLERLTEALNRDPEASPEALLAQVSAAVRDFVQEAEQFDDLTMLCLEYKGPARSEEDRK